MGRHPLDLMVDEWKSEEEKYFVTQPTSQDFFELYLIGNKKTGSQIKEWISPGTIEIGKKFESLDLSKPYIFEVDPNFEPEIEKFNRLLSTNTNPEKLPDIGYMELYKSSKLTDFITGSFLEYYGLIVSKTTKEIFKKHNLGDAKFYRITLQHKGNLFDDYFFFKTLSTGVEFIDYEKSSFYQQEGLLNFETRKDIEINSTNDIERHKKEFSGTDIYILAKKIILSENFPNYDYFTFSQFGIHKRFISSKLAAALKTNTGIEIKPTNRIYL